MDPYFSRPVRIARAAGVIGSWLIWAAALVIRFTTDIPQGVVLLIGVLGFTPYIVSIQLIEPWLMKRDRR